MRRAPILLLAVLLSGCSIERPELHGTLIEPAMAAPDFELTSADGPVRKSDFEGRLVVLSFGYTHCPDVCPTTLARLGRAMELLGPAAEEVQVLLITVDPERDGAEKVSAYARAFDPSFIGLSGTAEEVGRVAADFGIFHAKAEGSAATGYLVDHTATVTVLDRDGDTRLLWSFDVTPEEIAADLRYLVDR